MQVIGNHPKSKASIAVRRGPDGQIVSAVTGYYGYSSDLEAVPNFIWRGKLRANGFSRGRSSVRFLFLDPLGNEYEMSPNRHAALLNCLVKGDHVFEDECWIVGAWTFAMEGSNVSIVPVARDSTPDEET